MHQVRVVVHVLEVLEEEFVFALPLVCVRAPSWILALSSVFRC